MYRAQRDEICHNGGQNGNKCWFLDVAAQDRSWLVAKADPARLRIEQPLFLFGMPANGRSNASFFSGAVGRPELQPIMEWFLEQASGI